MKPRLLPLLAVFALRCIATEKRDPFQELVRPTEPLTPEQERAAFHLPPGFEIQLVASEPDAEIFVDGEDKGKSPATIASIAPGDHVVEARKPKFTSAQQTVHVVPGQNALAQLKMEIAPPDRPHAGLKVQSPVPNAEVFLDGSSLGKAPVDRADLDPGKHYVVVHKDGYTDIRGRFDYASVNTPERMAIQRFAVLVLSEEKGALIREAAPPQQ